MLGRLRSATQPIHRDLEQVLHGFADVDSAEKYEALLRRYLTVYEGLAEAAARSSVTGGWADDVSERCEWLKQDLAAIGERTASGSPAAAAAAEPKVADEMAPWRDQAEAAGCFYVVEGSALGGLRLAREFEARIGVTATRGGRFFAGRGARTGARWQAFCAWLESREWSAADEEAASRRAVATFGWFARNLADPVAGAVGG